MRGSTLEIETVYDPLRLHACCDAKFSRCGSNRVGVGDHKNLVEAGAHRLGMGRG